MNAIAQETARIFAECCSVIKQDVGLTHTEKYMEDAHEYNPSLKRPLCEAML